MGRGRKLNKKLFNEYCSSVKQNKDASFGSFTYSENHRFSSGTYYVFYTFDSMVVFKEGDIDFRENYNKETFDDVLYFDYKIDLYALVDKEILYELFSEGNLTEDEYKSYVFSKETKKTPYLIYEGANAEFPVLQHLPEQLDKLVDLKEDQMNYVGKRINKSSVYTNDSTVGSPRLNDMYYLHKTREVFLENEIERNTYVITVSIRDCFTGLNYSICLCNLNDEGIRFFKQTIADFIQDVLNFSRKKYRNEEV